MDSYEDDDDKTLAEFLESEILSETSDQEEEIDDQRVKKRRRIGEVEAASFLSNVPPELFRSILKHLSPEDLVCCSQACRSLNLAASDDSLWRRLYSLRWGPLPPEEENLRVSAWKKLYIQRDEMDTSKLFRNCPPEFKEYYRQMQTAKRSQAPLPSQVIDDLVTADKTVTDQVSAWKRSRGLSDDAVADHACSGETCTYFRIGDAIICEKTGNVHVCDDTSSCREILGYETVVCTISGRCFDALSMVPVDSDSDEEEEEEEEEILTDKASMDQGFQRGYSCRDEKELEALQVFMIQA